MNPLPTGAGRTLILTLILTLFSIQGNAQLVFSEVMAVNTQGEQNPRSGQPDDWIEIYNGTPYAIDLSAYYLSDDPDKPFKWRFPEQTYVMNYNYHLIWADGSNDTLSGSFTNFKLSASGETLFIHDLEGNLYDSLTFPRMFENVSYGVDSKGARVYFSNPTAKVKNDSESGFQIGGGVSFSPPPAIFPTARAVELSPENQAGIIRYTLDGSPPGLSDSVYTSPIQITGNTVIRARLWSDGFEPGEISTGSYIIHDQFTLPVISLVTDPDHLFDDQMGIYVEGTNGRPGYCESEPRNWNQNWEHPMSLEYFDREGSRQVQHDGGAKIHGGCSRQAPLKSLAFFARSKYGKNRIEYPFFSQKKADSFKGLILRNSGNDFWYSYMRDAVMQAVVTPHMNVDDQAYEPVQLFINGEYWGIHNLREKVNEHWVTSNYGIPDENLDFIKNSREVFAGSFDGYDSLQMFLQNHSLAEEANFQEMGRKVDLDSYRDYLFTHLFFGNRDWPGNNQKCWRDRAVGGKWRWVMFDLDFGFGLYDNNPSFDMFSFSTADTSDQWPNPSRATLIIRRLFENQGFREDFIGKYHMHLNSTFSPDHVNNVIDSFYYKLNDIFPAHLDRWNRDAQDDWQFRTMDEWEYEVDRLRQFGMARPDFVWENMRKFFALDSLIPLQIESLDGPGKIVANEVIVPRDGFEGKYTSGFKLDLEYIPEPGYKLDHWDIISLQALDTFLIPKKSGWKYDDTGIVPAEDWMAGDFDDSGWPEDQGILGYGDGTESTTLDFGGDPQNKNITSYFRTRVEIENPGEYDRFMIRLLRDDGAAIYINGREVIRDNLPGGKLDHWTLAETVVGGEDESTYFEYPVATGYFTGGINTLAVEVHQQSSSSSDLNFDLELIATTYIPVDTFSMDGNIQSMNPRDGIRIRANISETVFDPDWELYINEFMASNNSGHTDEYGEDEDWIEIFNAGEQDVDLAGLYLTDDLANPDKWQIPAGAPEITTVGANNYLVFYADNDVSQGPLHLGFKLGSGGEEIGLSHLSGTMLHWLDSLTYGPQLTDISYGRYPDGNLAWLNMESSTPWMSNLVTGVSKQQFVGGGIRIYPNPVSDQIYFHLDNLNAGNESELSWSIYDIRGRNVKNEISTFGGAGYTRTIHVADLRAGLYILVVKFGQERYTTRFVKSKQ